MGRGEESQAAEMQPVQFLICLQPANCTCFLVLPLKAEVLHRDFGAETQVEALISITETDSDTSKALPIPQVTG